MVLVSIWYSIDFIIEFYGAPKNYKDFLSNSMKTTLLKNLGKILQDLVKVLYDLGKILRDHGKILPRSCQKIIQDLDSRSWQDPDKILARFW
jgi:hypothetical protein